MLSKKMEKALNVQVAAEMFSSNLYLAMALDFEAKNMKGFGKWLRVQAREEMGHATKLIDFIIERGGRAVVPALDAPPVAWKSAQAAFDQVLAHEIKVTGMINGLVDAAAAEKDHASGIFLQWFVTEQVEEEAQSVEIVETLKMIGDSKGSLYMLDHRLGKRE
jgi:ferritin